MGSLLSSSLIFTIQLRLGDCVEEMAKMPADSVDAIVTDPPYGLEFMGKEWDSLGGRPVDTRLLVEPEAAMGFQDGSGGNAFSRSRVRNGQGSDPKAQQAWHETWAREAFRVLKSGGHLLAFGGTRTYHRMVCAIEDAGFEIRDSVYWVYGSGFPKSKSMKDIGRPELGTALKPAQEPICVARKPLSEKNVAQNVLKHGTGAINVDATRVGTADLSHEYNRKDFNGMGYGGAAKEHEVVNPGKQGRWPPNLLLSHHPDCNRECVAGCPVHEMDRQSGQSKDGIAYKRNGRNGHDGGWGSYDEKWGGYTGKGGASRFFPRFEAELEAPFRYVAKTSRRERNAGLPEGEASTHPTVKPIALMRWLVRLVTPPGGTVLDPFMGSGSTGCAAVQEGFDFIGIEMDESYTEIARRRIAYWAEKSPIVNTEIAEVADPTDSTFTGRLF